MTLLICNRHGISAHRKTGVKQPRWKCSACDYDYSRRYLQALKSKAREYAGGCCQLCGYDKCGRALHFHHIDPTTKLFDVMGCKSGRKVVRSWEVVKNEIDKCILVCMNCHMEAHNQEPHEAQEPVLALDRTRIHSLNKRIIAGIETAQQAWDRVISALHASR